MSKWKLYWVASDGAEDCFVVAKNSRSAKAVEKDMCGFEDDDLTVMRVKDIPDEYEKIANDKFRKWSKDNNCNSHLNIDDLTAWPYYAPDWLLEKLGAEFRYIDGIKQTLIDDVVYAPNHVYSIGLKAMNELSKLYGNKPINTSNVNYEGIEEVIETMLGKSIIIIHRLEDCITKSFIFAVGNDKYKDYTVNELTKLWKEKFTFGKLINLIEERFEIKEDVLDSLKLFLKQRNKIAHGLTLEDRYDINTFWGKKEIVGFLALFIQNAMILEIIMESALVATISFSYDLMQKDEEMCNDELKKEIERFNSSEDTMEKLMLFFDVFHIKE